MQEKYRSEVRRKLLRVVAVCALIVMILILSRWTGQENAARFETAEQRMDYLMSIGLTPVRGSEEYHSVKLPEEFDDVLREYNELQQSQGFDLLPYAGRDCDQYTYELENYEKYSGTAYATLYFCSGTLIGGDIHSAEAEGFMCALSE